jgi:hypothetical protein
LYPDRITEHRQICATNLFVANEPLYDLSLPEIVATPSAFVETLREREGSARISNPRVFTAVEPFDLPRLADLTPVDREAVTEVNTLEPEINVLWNIESANTYLPSSSARFADLNARGWWKVHPGLFSDGYLIATEDSFMRSGADLAQALAVNSALGLVLVEIPNRMPRAFLSDVRCVAGRAESLEAVMSPAFDPMREAIVECAAASGPSKASGRGPPGRVTVLSYKPERVEIQVDARADAVLVLNDAYYNGWVAMVDGQPVEILHANHVVRAVPVTPGSHQVVFTYRTPGLRAAGALSLVSTALAFSGGAWLRRRRRDPAHAPRPPRIGPR